MNWKQCSALAVVMVVLVFCLQSPAQHTSNIPIKMRVEPNKLGAAARIILYGSDGEEIARFQATAGDPYQGGTMLPSGAVTWRDSARVVHTVVGTMVIESQ